MTGKMVLIVEDEPGTANMYRIVLEVEGYETFVAYTAAVVADWMCVAISAAKRNFPIYP